ncbi:hypothetical protein Tco_0634560 [Tanacetum coccineum]
MPICQSFYIIEAENYYCQAKVNAVEMTWVPKLQLLTKFLSLEALFEGRILTYIVKAVLKESKASRHVKRGRDTKIPQSSGPPEKGDYWCIIPNATQLQLNAAKLKLMLLGLN